MMAAKMIGKEMAYQPAPLLSAENLKSALWAVLWLAVIALGIWALGTALRYLFPSFDFPQWVSSAIIGIYMLIMGRESWSAWKIDPKSLDFEASQEVTRGRVGSIFFAAFAAVPLLLAYAHYPE